MTKKPCKQAETTKGSRPGSAHSNRELRVGTQKDVKLIQKQQLWVKTTLELARWSLLVRVRCSIRPLGPTVHHTILVSTLCHWRQMSQRLTRTSSFRETPNCVGWVSLPVLKRTSSFWTSRSFTAKFLHRTQFKGPRFSGHPRSRNSSFRRGLESLIWFSSSTALTIRFNKFAVRYVAMILAT